ncbi:MAG: PDZ domain-containing protein [Candidatus Aminicenantes bacterium]|nr:MAG: PDZ domain-containing protein [Candidatus Aminicenantes bacterium]
MSKKSAKLVLLTVLAVISLLLIAERSLIPGLFSNLSPDNSFDLLAIVIHNIRNNYIEEVNPEQTMTGALKGMVNSLDALSCYLDQESMQRHSQRMETDLKDIGVVLYKRYGTFPLVIGIIENSPAQKRGIQIGDSISAIDNKAPQMMSLLEATLYLKDRDEKPVKLRTIRGNKTQEISVERTQLYEEPVSFTPAEGTSGILKIHHLNPPSVKTAKEKILSRLQSVKNPLILDLRNCYEGDIQEARKLINIFLKASKIGYFANKEDPKEYLGCPDNAELEKLPLVVWTNQATYGPAEIVAGVLQEFKRAKIIGLQTPGLAAKHKFFRLEDGSGLLLTSGIFHLNSGKKLWEKGVEPDVKIKIEEQSDSIYLKKSFSS